MKSRFFKPFRIRLDRCEESYETLYNPERGWYYITRIELDEMVVTPKRYLNSRNGIELLEINLMKYREGSIPKQALQQLYNIFLLSREAKKKLILRFTYDMIGNCRATEPDTISVILLHMEELKDLFFEFQDIIFLYQGIFMGSWGEMHDSKFANTVDMQKLFQKMASVTPDTAYIAVRTPAQYRSITQCLGVCYKKDSSKGKGFYRLGLFNDSIVSSETDFGTYGTIPKEKARHYYEKWCRADELAFQNELMKRTPSGGETSALYEAMCMEEVVEELRTTGITYLNNEYHPEVISRWESEKIEKGPYKGKTYYDYIGDHLGYRLVIQDMKQSQKKGRITIDIHIENKGFAPLYKEKAIRLLLKNEMGEDIVTKYEEGCALFQKLHLVFTIETAQLRAEQYTIYLQIIDPCCDQLIACANAGFDESLGNKLGTIRRR